MIVKVIVKLSVEILICNLKSQKHFHESRLGRTWDVWHEGMEIMSFIRET